MRSMRPWVTCGMEAAQPAVEPLVGLVGADGDLADPAHAALQRPAGGRHLSRRGADRARAPRRRRARAGRKRRLAGGRARTPPAGAAPRSKPDRPGGEAARRRARRRPTIRIAPCRGSARMRAASGRTSAQRPSTTCAKRPSWRRSRRSGRARTLQLQDCRASRRRPPAAGPAARDSKANSTRSLLTSTPRIHLPRAVHCCFDANQKRFAESIRVRVCSERHAIAVRAARLRMKSSPRSVPSPAAPGAAEAPVLEAAARRSAPRGGCARGSGAGR